MQETHLIPEPRPPAADFVLHAGLHLNAHVAPEHARRGLADRPVDPRLRI